MTNADNIVAGGTVPAEWGERAAEVSAVCKQGFVDLEYARANNPQVPATRFERDENNVTIMDDELDGDGNVVGQSPRLMVLTDNSGNPVMEDDPLIHREKHHGLHAYSYEPCSDGSVVALWANDESGQIKMKAFANIEEASLWSPRDERADS